MFSLTFYFKFKMQYLLWRKRHKISISVSTKWQVMRVYLKFRALPVPSCLLMCISYMYENCFCYLPCSSLFIAKEKKSVTSPFSFPDYHFYGSTGNSFWLCLSPEKIANLHGEIWQAVQCSMIRRLDVLGILILRKLNDLWMIVRAFWYLKKQCYRK